MVRDIVKQMNLCANYICSGNKGMYDIDIA